MKKKLQPKMNTLLSLVIIVVLAPLLCTVFLQRMQMEQVLAGIDAVSGGGAAEGTELVPEGTECAAEDTERISEERVQEAEELLPGIVAKEIGVSAEPEAIRAQCVIARTNLYDAWETGTEEPAALTQEEMRALWGEDFQETYRCMEKYVASTRGEVLTWNGACIYAAYHAVSAGSTRNMSELYTDAKMPYLTAVPCREDTFSEDYLAVSYMEEEEFLKLCGEAFPEALLSAADEVTVVKRDAADYVLEVSIGENVVSGEEFRQKLGLASACFSVTVDEGTVRMVTKGVGHGFGLSQYTAGLLAKEGKDYREILDTFYPGTEITTFP